MNTIFERVDEQEAASEPKIVMDVQNITKSLPLGREQIEILKGISFQMS
jgi:putative ABC transport system ATP-binding protein